MAQCFFLGGSTTSFLKCDFPKNYGITYFDKFISNNFGRLFCSIAQTDLSCRRIPIPGRKQFLCVLPSWAVEGVYEGRKRRRSREMSCWMRM